MSTQKTLKENHSDYRDQLILERYRQQAGTIHQIAREFGVSGLHVSDLIREAQLESQRVKGAETARIVEIEGEVVWAVPTCQLGYRSGTKAICEEIEHLQASQPDSQVLVAICLVPKVEHIHMTELPPEPVAAPVPERMQTAAVSHG